jgi:4-amino-4-deoxy-L-arabinose transferase-like glycosyltransferase
VAYYLVALPVMFAPWSVFLLAVLWYGVRGTKRIAEADDPALEHARRAHRFLVCWLGVYFVFFSAAATKLPNYIFPLYPALAILTARFLIAWRDGLLAVPQWMMAAAVGAMALVGVVVAGGLVFANRLFPGLAVCALLGLIPLTGAIAMARALRRGDRSALVTAATVASILFLGLLVAVPPSVVDRQKAPRELVRASGVDNPARDVRLAEFRWYPPSVVYYSGREVSELDTPEKAVEFLEVPTPGYLFVPEPLWRELLASRVKNYRIVARHNDFMEKCNILVITNESADVARR